MFLLLFLLVQHPLALVALVVVLMVLILRPYYSPPGVPSVSATPVSGFNLSSASNALAPPRCLATRFAAKSDASLTLS
jgi:hypothetical protein